MKIHNAKYKCGSSIRIKGYEDTTCFITSCVWCVDIKEWVYCIISELSCIVSDIIEPALSIVEIKSP